MQKMLRHAHGRKYTSNTIENVTTHEPVHETITTCKNKQMKMDINIQMNMDAYACYMP